MHPGGGGAGENGGIPSPSHAGDGRGSLTKEEGEEGDLERDISNIRSNIITILNL